MKSGAHDSEHLDGVRVQPLKLLPNARGRLMEVQRADDAIFPGFGQAYITSTYPGVVKAWYRHNKQIDQISVIKGLLKLVLFDARPDSPSSNRLEEIVMGELAPKLVQIPPGLWHGFQAIGPDETFLLHLNSTAANLADPDEERIPFDDPRIPYHWG
jgi:dTDP-4-dehydrorhamnose 3,5-epimerase